MVTVTKLNTEEDEDDASCADDKIEPAFKITSFASIFAQYRTFLYAYSVYSTCIHSMRSFM